MTFITWLLICFAFGSLPLSPWLGRLALKVDIRSYGDGNPGAFNVWRAGGAKWGMLAILLDALKGAIPVAAANFAVGLDGVEMGLAATAPILGHAYSPFLKFDGGKAIAVTFGAWTGLSLFVVPGTLGILFGLWLSLVSPHGWAVFMGLLTLGGLIFSLAPPVSWVVLYLAGSMIVLWKHREELRQPPVLKLKKAGNDA